MNTNHTNNLDKLTTVNKLKDIFSTSFKDFIKIGVINIQGGYNKKIEGIIDFFNKENFSILGLVETGLHRNQNETKNKYTPNNRTNPSYYIFHDDTDATEELTLEPNIIKEHIINHFQNLGDNSQQISYNAASHLNLPPEWALIYTSKNYIQSDWFTTINDPITLTELQDTLSSLPNNKASGPSSITYKDIKHLDNHTKNFLVEFFNLILTHHIYPKE
ncbi:hypothetical protein C1645_833040 [Glomus cerebriforme]|uniref:Uncharacterized protein n=1 Tax=Glomus cerebriforme TaxID=658196 RepID=A0A397SCA7_9GLOM|nr:hypothetical protein C1645_833040 [Glomus cerebriforme]